MFRSETTITRPGRDRPVRIPRSKANLLRWGLFIDELLREVDQARVVAPAPVPPDVVDREGDGPPPGRGAREARGLHADVSG